MKNYLTKTEEFYPMSAWVSKPNVADELFNEQKKKTRFVHLSRPLSV